MKNYIFAIIGAAVLILLAICAIAAPVIAPFTANELAGLPLQPPSGVHLFGTDDIGRDIFSFVIYGTRSALLIGILAALLALVVGAVIGSVAAFVGGATESVLMRFAELFQIMPLLILALVMVAFWGADIWLTVLAVGIAIWPLEARIIYGEVRKIRDLDYVSAARVNGFGAIHIIFIEILPNAIPPAIVQVTLDAGLAILIQAGLGFLGLSDPLVPNWGQMIKDAQNYLDQAWWMGVMPGLAITATVIGFAFLGEGLNEAIESN